MIRKNTTMTTKFTDYQKIHIIIESDLVNATHKEMLECPPIYPI